MWRDSQIVCVTVNAPRSSHGPAIQPSGAQSKQRPLDTRPAAREILPSARAQGARHQAAGCRQATAEAGYGGLLCRCNVAGEKGEPQSAAGEKRLNAVVPI